MQLPINPTNIGVMKMAQALYSNEQKGVSVLSNIFMSKQRAMDFITSGAGVLVAYDPRTPNGAALIQVIENAGYGDLALAKLLIESLGIDESTDWAAIVDDAAVMTVIFADPVAREIVFNSNTAMTAITDSTIALDVLLSIPDAYNRLTEHSVAFPIAAANSLSWNKIFANTSMMSRICNSAVSMKIIADMPIPNIALGQIAAHAQHSAMVENSANAKAGLAGSHSIVGSTRSHINYQESTVVVYTKKAWIIDVQKQEQSGLSPVASGINVTNLINTPKNISTASVNPGFVLAVNRFGNNVTVELAGNSYTRYIPIE